MASPYWASEVELWPLFGQGCPEDAPHDIPYLRMAADQGNDGAAGLIEYAYYSCKGVQQSYDEALRWFRRGHDLQDGLAMLSLAGMYDRGLAVPKDPAQNAELLKSAAEKAAMAPHLWVAWAMRPEKGVGVSPQPEAALRYYRKAADVGYPDGIAHLSRCYRDGVGTPKDVKLADQWTRRHQEAIEAIRASRKSP